MGCAFASSVAAQRPATATAPAPGPAVTSESMLDSPEYRAAIADAVNEFRVGNWAEAKTLFREAHRLYPNARTLRGLGIVAFELRQYVEAMTLLQQALVDQRKPLDAGQRREAADQIARAERFVARLALQLAPANATVTVDGEAGSFNDQHELLVAAGERAVLVSAPGYESQTKRIEVEGGMRYGLVLQLVPSPVSASTPPATPATTATASSSASADGADRASGFFIPLGPAIVAGSGAALLIVSAITGSLALSAQSDLKDACPDKSMCDQRNADTADRADALATATDVLWVTGVVAVGAGVSWWLLGKHRADSTQVGALVTPDRAALSLQRRF